MINPSFIVKLMKDANGLLVGKKCGLYHRRCIAIGQLTLIHFFCPTVLELES